MTPGRNVFIPNRVFHDYSDAKRFGKLIALSQGSIDSMNLNDIEFKFKEKLLGAHSEDFILMSGSPLLNVIAATIFLRNFGQAKLLQWDGVMREYNLITLEGEVAGVSS